MSRYWVTFSLAVKPPFNAEGRLHSEITETGCVAIDTDGTDARDVYRTVSDEIQSALVRAKEKYDNGKTIAAKDGRDPQDARE